MEIDTYTLITGATSGIGKETAIKLSQSTKLVLHGRNVNRLDDLLQLCTNPEKHIVWQHDLESIETIEQSITTAFFSKTGHHINNFIHCAGALAVAPMRSMDPSTVRKIMDVTFGSAVEMVRILVKKKINNRQLKNIIFISSTASKFGAKGFNVYCASKGALDAFMRAIAVELAPDVRSNSILPGAIRTAMTETMFNDPQMNERIQAGYPLGIGKPSDIVSVMEFLLSDQSRWITGQQFVVDGGRTVNITA